MPDYDLPSVMQALRAADAAGDTDGATRLAQIAQGMQSGTRAPASDTSNSSFLGELGTGAVSGINTLDRGLTNTALFFDKMRGDTEAEAKHKAMLESSAQAYNQYQNENPVAVPSMKDIHSGHDFALYAGNRLGAALPNIAGTLGGAVVGGPIGAAIGGGAAGALQGGQEAADQTGGDPVSTAAGAAIGGAAGAIPVPFLKPGGAVGAKTLGDALYGVGSSGLQGAAGGALGGTVQAGLGNIPEALHTGKIADAVPSLSQLEEGALSGGLAGGVMGAAHGLVRGGGDGDAVEAPADVSEAAAARARLAQRIKSEADANDITLGKQLKYGAPKGDEAVLENVHNSMGEEIKGLSKVLSEEMDPAKASDFEDLMNRTSLQATMRDARNKLKGNASEEDIAKLQDAVGHTQEGAALVDLVRQSNELTNLFRGGMKGGVSQYTDYATPFTRGGSENGRGFGSADTFRALEALHFVANPLHSVLGTGAMLGGRAIDAVTGKRSNVAKFVSDNAPNAVPLDFDGKPSLTRARFDALQQAQPVSIDPAEAQRLAQREQALYSQKFLDNNPGLGGFLKSLYDQTGLMPHEARAGMLELQRTGAVTPDEFQAFHTDPSKLMQNKIGLHIMDMLDNMASKGQLQRAPDWQGQAAAQGPAISNPISYAAAANGNQARVTASQGRVANSAHSPAIKQAINYASGAIGRTNNRADAMQVHNAAVNALAHNPAAQSYAAQELKPLVSQIRHATPKDAAAARQGIPLSPRDKIDVAQKAEALVKTPTVDTITAALKDDAPVFARMFNRLAYKETHPVHALSDALTELTRWIHNDRPDNY